jgi:hypothetical protein
MKLIQLKLFEYKCLTGISLVRLNKNWTLNMNETTTQILLELGVLCFFGFLYYLWQRRKIIRNDIYDIYQQLDHLVYNINEFLKEDNNAVDFKDLAQFNLALENAIKSDDLSSISKSVSTKVDKIPEEIQTDIAKLSEQINFHTK